MSLKLYGWLPDKTSLLVLMEEHVVNGAWDGTFDADGFFCHGRSKAVFLEDVSEEDEDTGYNEIIARYEDRQRRKK